ncbi:hypothetical protein [Lacipirellula sp.]|uniref:hypothetical protein n=1 Tax=Lacipirellula sp. TaxID=2691419 RepID=UPI003D0D4017
MTHYLLLIHGNARSDPSPAEWAAFFHTAEQSGLFRGGSAIGGRTILGDAANAQPSDHIVGYMRFDADDKQPLLDLLHTHPVIAHGGTVELCELPET